MSKARMQGCSCQGLSGRPQLAATGGLGLGGAKRVNQHTMPCSNVILLLSGYSHSLSSQAYLADMAFHNEAMMKPFAGVV